MSLVPKWRPHNEWALRSNGTGTGRVLMHRSCNEQGLTLHGQPAVWKDWATFPSYNDAEQLLLILTSDAAKRANERLSLLLTAAQAVIGEWDQRGDGGCMSAVQTMLREAVDAVE